LWGCDGLIRLIILLITSGDSHKQQYTGNRHSLETYHYLTPQKIQGIILDGIGLKGSTTATATTRIVSFIKIVNYKTDT
jgi:hypothetical protein